MDAFYVVWCPIGGPPRKRHGYEYDAQKEAARLAQENPGQEFYVLRASHHFKRTDVTVTQLVEPVPF